MCASLQRTCSSGFACPQYLSLETYANPCKAYTAGAVIVSTGACNTQGVCTQEARLCSDGSVMPRNMQTCAWLPHLCPNQPSVCTLEMRYCSDGSVMQRNTQTCEWLPSLCPDETDPYTYAYQHGITSMPTRFLFRPYDTITRQEATKMILAAIPLLNNGYELSSLNDCSRGFLDEDRFDRSLTPTAYRMCEL